MLPPRPAYNPQETGRGRGYAGRQAENEALSGTETGRRMGRAAAFGHPAGRGRGHFWKTGVAGGSAAVPAHRAACRHADALPGHTWYALQLGAFDSADAAESLAASYRSRGAAGYVRVQGQYRVLAAAYAARADAQAVITQLRTRHQVDAVLTEIVQPEVTLRMVGRPDQLTALADASALVVGSPTHNNTVLPYVMSALTYIKGLRPKILVGGAFGSFGWSGESPKILNEFLASMKIELPCEPVREQWRPGHEGLQRAHDMGVAIAKTLKAKCGE